MDNGRTGLVVVTYWSGEGGGALLDTEGWTRLGWDRTENNERSGGLDDGNSDGRESCRMSGLHSTDALASNVIWRRAV